ncbi:hypothetical protein TEQG_07640 [Trichophyton equinum CBS 127.97]|uniref:Uncharacterized protein n=1 Tax=Trichophyton equinum (strain ATCC MYA-4606 / CBS 127.97) TaxID=559882 RepID=F2Q3G3_TRIEC|nr:hypothetical protein TEQG_07640 [Trichophyton equinum CBS 127.97]
MWYITAHKAIMLAGLRDAITSRSQLAALEPLAQSRLSISRRTSKASQRPRWQKQRWWTVGSYAVVCLYKKAAKEKGRKIRGHSKRAAFASLHQAHWTLHVTSFCLLSRAHPMRVKPHGHAAYGGLPEAGQVDVKGGKKKGIIVVNTGANRTAVSSQLGRGLTVDNNKGTRASCHAVGGHRCPGHEGKRFMEIEAEALGAGPGPVLAKILA